LRKLGRDVRVLKELLTDSHLESVWSIRCSAVSGSQWFIAPSEEGGAREEEAAAAFARE